jgi:outer membrane protein assembly factor BamC
VVVERSESNFSISMLISESVMKVVGITLTVVAAAIIAGGCSSWSYGNKIDYGSAERLPPLEVPPDLAEPRRSERFDVDDGATFSDYTKAREGAVATERGQVVLPQEEGMRIEGAADYRWLVVNMEPDQLWQPIREFWQQTGFLIAIEDPRLGLIETDWAENLAKTNDSWFGRTFGALKLVYSLGERDKFRTRVERGEEPGTSEIYISHRGLVQQNQNQQLRANSTLPEKGYWQVRPRDPDLEAVMLHRLMAKLGGTQEQIEQAKAAPAPAPRAELTTREDSLEYLALQDTFDKAWRRVGLALDYIGFTVEDRDRSEGVYFVRYNDPDADVEKSGLDKLAFWRDDEPVNQKFQIRVAGMEDRGSEVRVLDESGATLATQTSSRILVLLRDQLK